MTAVSTVDAFSNRHEINWAKAHREVRTIQRRISKVVREGKTLKTVLLAHERGLIKA